MLDLLYSLAIGAAWLLLRVWTGRETVFSTDSGVYAGMAQGIKAPDPYRLRWLLPFLMPKQADFCVRANVSATGLWASFPAMYLFADAAGVNGLWACAIWGALPIVCILWRLPGLVDQVSWPIGLLTGYLFLTGHIEAAIVLSLIGGLTEPRLPVIVAAWTLNPWALTGLLSVAALWKFAPRGSAAIMENPEPILHPWRTGMRQNGSRAYSAPDMLLPWGACLAGLCAMTGPVLLSLATSYGQLLRVTDRVRLYQWAAPVMIVAALGVLPEWSLPVAVAVTWFNPCRGEE